jgi:hypothetical protein
MRYDKRFVILNYETDAGTGDEELDGLSFCDYIQGMYIHADEWLEEHVCSNYGIGHTINEAFEDFKKRYKNKF